MGWQTSSLLYLLTASFFAIYQRKLASDRRYKKANFQILAVFFTVTYLISLLVFLPSGNILSVDSLKYQIVISGVLLALSNIMFYFVFRYLEAAYATILSTLSTVFNIFIASLFLNQRLNALQYIGSLMVMSSVIALFYFTKKDRNKNIAKGIIIAVCGSIIGSISISLENHIIKTTNQATFALYGVGTQWLFVAIISLMIRPKQYLILKNSDFLTKVMPASLLRGVSGASFISAEVTGNLSILSSIVASRVTFITILAALILGERAHLGRKIFLAICSTAGLFLLF